MEAMIRAKDVIDPQYLERYISEREIISRQLFYIKNNLIIIEKITNFPFPLLGGGTPFWTFTSKAYFDSSILLLSTLFVDETNEFSLWRFYKKVNWEWKRADICGDVESELVRRLDQVNFKKRRIAIKDRVKSVRNSHIAHLDYKTKMGIEPGMAYSLELAEFEKALRIANDLFRILCFEHGFVLEEWSYAPRPNAVDYLTDIDEMLNYIARNSYWFQDVEYEAIRHDRQEEFDTLPQGERQILLEWKVRLGVPFSFEK